jgi:hypothetical protein
MPVNSKMPGLKTTGSVSWFIRRVILYIMQIYCCCYCLNPWCDNRELEKHDKEAGGWRSEEEMAQEAESFRKTWN